jgi:hypothetical protein
LFKNQLALIKGPHKIHVIASLLIQQVLGFGIISWIQGFSDLRDISLCIVDAILTAPMLVGLMNLVLFMQIGATGLLIMRLILERRIAKNSDSERRDVASAEKGGGFGLKRNDSMKTSGFDATPVPDPAVRPPLEEIRTVVAR